MVEVTEFVLYSTIKDENYVTEIKNKLQLKTNEHYALHALNIHGTFFERTCQNVVRSTKGWTIQETNYPVEYRGEASNLDIWAEAKSDMNARIELLIECKKNNQQFVDWVFFPQPAHRPIDSPIRMIQVRNPSGAGNSWVTHREFRQLNHHLIITDEAREIKGDYLKIRERQDWTKTSNTAITDAARQITLATQTLIEQEYCVLEELKGINQKQHTSASALYSQLLFFPTIVTTANLFTCEFQETDVELSTGEIPVEKAKLVPQSFLMFEYPIPSVLQQSPQDMGQEYTREALKLVSRMPIFVVHSANFPTFLSQIPRLNLKEDLVGIPVYEIDLKPGKCEVAMQNTDEV